MASSLFASIDELSDLLREVHSLSEKWRGRVYSILLSAVDRPTVMFRPADFDRLVLELKMESHPVRSSSGLVFLVMPFGAVDVACVLPDETEPVS